VATAFLEVYYSGSAAGKSGTIHQFQTPIREAWWLWRLYRPIGEPVPAALLPVLAIGILMPHLLGSFVVIESLRGAFGPARGAAVSLWCLRGLLFCWLAFSSVRLVWPMRSVLRMLGAVNVALLTLLPWLVSTRWSERSSSHAVRHGVIVGSLLSLVWFGHLLLPKWTPTHSNTFLSLAASTLILVGSLFGRRETPDPDEQVRPSPESG